MTVQVIHRDFTNPNLPTKHKGRPSQQGDICERDANEDLEYADEDLEKDGI
ncbi:hypothetical protein SESBI_47849 [Sesbania bispinosa]|nr:hypothetical protein SESBI_47849 [Sesbania bispinosa]